jgi:AcrR family transcriptional regulator
VSARRSGPADWCRAGLALLRDHGPQAVTLDRLCAALEKTKGSFYHHFRDMDAYQAALLAEWEELHTGGPIAAASRARAARRRSALLDAVALNLDHDLDRAVRAWGRHHAGARAALRRVDGRRMAFLAELHREQGQADPRGLAELEYAVFLGAQELGLVEDPERGLPLRRALHAALEALGEPASAPRGAGRRR